MADSETDVLLQLGCLSDDSQKALMGRLALYASNRARRYGWRPPDSIPGGHQVQDVVMEAIELVCTGQRKWDQARFPDLEIFLMAVIKSLLSHIRTSAENRSRPPDTTHVAGQDPYEGIPDPTQKNVEEELMDDQWVQEVHDCLGGEVELELVLLGILKGDTRAEIAQDLGITPSEVTLLVRKIQRRVASVGVEPQSMIGGG